MSIWSSAIDWQSIFLVRMAGTLFSSTIDPLLIQLLSPFEIRGPCKMFHYAPLAPPCVRPVLHDTRLHAGPRGSIKRVGSWRFCYTLYTIQLNTNNADVYTTHSCIHHTRQLYTHHTSVDTPHSTTPHHITARRLIFHTLTVAGDTTLPPTYFCRNLSLCGVVW